MINSRQKRFVEEYLANGYNARNAYKVAYNKTENKDYTYPYELIKNPDVQEYLQKRRQEIYESLNIDAIRVMQEIADIAFEEKTYENKMVKVKALDLLSKNLNLQTIKTENKDVIEVQLVEDLEENV